MDLPQTVSTNIARVADLIRGVPICMLTTVLGDGLPHARPMIAQDEAFDGRLWFLVEREAHLVQEIRRNPHVGVTYADTVTHRYVSLSGKARIVEDPAVVARLWRASMEGWFPDGPLDPRIALVQVEPAMAWFWEGPPTTGARILDLAKSLLTGEGGEPQAGASGRLQL
jgi:general stress protein 26